MEFCCKNLFLFFKQAQMSPYRAANSMTGYTRCWAKSACLPCRIVAAAGSLQTGAGEGDTAGAAAASVPRVCPVDPSYLLPCVCCCPWLRDGPQLASLWKGRSGQAWDEGRGGGRCGRRGVRREEAGGQRSWFEHA